MEETQVALQGAYSAADILNQQLEVLLVYLFRDSVREQLLLVFLMLFGSLAAVRGLHWAGNRAMNRAVRNRSERIRQFALERFLPAIEQLYFPVLVFLAFARFGAVRVSIQQPSLLIGLFLFVFILAVYRFVIAILYLILTRRRFKRFHYRVLAPLFYVLLLVIILSTLVDLRLVSSVKLLTVYETPITIGRLLEAGLFFYIFITLGWIVQDALQMTLERLEQKETTRRTVLTVSRFLVITLGILFTLVTMGFNMAALAAIAGGLSLGAGLGLQRLIGNFVSGVVLIFGQSVRPGDLIEYDGKMGLVERLSIRTTTMRTFDNIDLIIPNENLLNSTITTHVNDVARKRIKINVGVSHESDPGEIRDLLIETAQRHGLVLENPEPFAYFKDYDDWGLEFTLLVWVGSLDKRFSTENDLRYMIWEALKSQGIQIAHPWRDVHLSVNPDSATQSD